jgi:TetR/AcrR family transcriptional regulator, transcriptional repressor for nem operon
MNQSSSGKSPDAGHTPQTQAAGRILDVAELLAQTRGYNGFSYADIALRLGVTKASLHYHFPSKAELGRALIARYHAAFEQALQAIDRKSADAAEKLRRYVGLYDGVLRNDRMCLCGMLAAEYATLQPAMQIALTSFFDLNERWLTAVLESGCGAGSFILQEPPAERARVLLGALEGAMLVARSYGDPHRFRAAADHILGDLCRTPRSASRSGRSTRGKPARKPPAKARP